MPSFGRQKQVALGGTCQQTQSHGWRKTKLKWANFWLARAAYGR